MSRQGDPDRRNEDEWWQQLYGAPAGDTAPPPGGDSVDDRYAGIRSVFDGRPGGPPGPGTPGGQEPPPGPPAQDPRPAPWHFPGRTPPRDPSAGRDPRPPSPGGAPLPDGPPDAPPGRSPSPGPARTPGAQQPPAAPARPPGPAQAPDRRDGPDRPGPSPWDAMPRGAAAPPGTAAPAPVPAPRRPIPDAAIPGGYDGPPGYVGDRPPTYEPEPTAWPAADPEFMEALTPDTVLDGARYGAVTVRAASVRGDSARYRGEPRRDALLTVRFGAADTSLLLLAVACGERSGEGSHLAAREVCRWIASAVGRHSERLVQDIRAADRGTLKAGLHRLTDRCLGQLAVRAQERGVDPEEYRASLRCLLVPADPGCRTRVFFGVGEGGLFRLRGAAWQDLDPPLIGPRPDALEESPRFRFRASVGRPGDTLMLCSAGMAAPMREEPALAALLAGRWTADREPPGLAAFLRDAQVRVKGYADDRTVVAAWEE